MRSYTKCFQLGKNRMIESLLEGEVEVQEKIDGSQFRIVVEPSGEIKFGSKSVDYEDHEKVDKTFRLAVDNAVKNIGKALKDCPTSDQKILIFTEFLRSPKHNTLNYERVPKNNLVVFDIGIELPDGFITWADKEMREAFCKAFDFEPVSVLFNGNGKDLTQEKILELLKIKSALGNETVEGIVIKNYGKRFDSIKFPYLDQFFMAGKFVRREFTERNNTEWKIKKGTVEGIVESINKEARWRKTVQHLRDDGKLENNMRDMVNLIPEVEKDFEEEEMENIKEILWNANKHRILSSLKAGMAEFYKTFLMEKMFEKDEDKERLAEFETNV